MAADSGLTAIAGGRPGEDRVLTIPNALSLLRLACGPLFLWLLFWAPHPHRAAAAYLLGVLGATDWVDGYIARHLRQVSTLGKVLDPAADRILLGIAVIGILVDHSVPTWLAVVVIVREILVSAAVLGLAALGARRIDVQWAGKAGTFCLLWTFPLFLAGHADDLSWHAIAGFLGWCFAVPGLALSWYAALTYVPMARRALAEGRVGSSP